MADFINTVDLLGDEAVVDSIIDRSITEFKDDEITKIGTHAFHECTALETVVLPNAKTIYDDAFCGCSALREVILPNVLTLSYTVFSGCSSLETVYMPEFVGRRDNVYYGGWFSSCTSLKKVVFPKMLKTAFTGMFQHCTALKTVDFPAATWIGVGTFAYCRSLTTLILRTVDAVCVSNAGLNDTNIASGTGYIYVPRALVDSYKAATNWSTYAAQFRALEDYTVDGTTTGELDETKI